MFYSVSQAFGGEQPHGNDTISFWTYPQEITNIVKSVLNLILSKLREAMCHHLLFREMSDNQLSSTIPASFNKLKNLQILLSLYSLNIRILSEWQPINEQINIFRRLANNRMEGNVPSLIWSFPSQEFL